MDKEIKIWRGEESDGYVFSGIASIEREKKFVKLQRNEEIMTAKIIPLKRRAIIIAVNSNKPHAENFYFESVNLNCKYFRSDCAKNPETDQAVPWSCSLKTIKK
ncbi:MAG: hypothetical protein PHW72_02545 [Candidatus Pacebacteria bacterium]|nr:hypothetical protein [Candidatus Paceibacterota bacterium]